MGDLGKMNYEDQWTILWFKQSKMNYINLGKV